MFLLLLCLAPPALARRSRSRRTRHSVNSDPILNQPFPLKVDAQANSAPAPVPQPVPPPQPEPVQPPQTQPQIQQVPQVIYNVPQYAPMPPAGFRAPVGYNTPNLRGYLGPQPQMVMPQYVPLQPPPNYYRVVPVQKPVRMVRSVANQAGRGILDDQAVFDELIHQSISGNRYDDLLDDGSSIGIDDFNSATNGDKRHRRSRHHHRRAL